MQVLNRQKRIQDGICVLGILFVLFAARATSCDNRFPGLDNPAKGKRNLLPNPEFDDPLPDSSWAIGDTQGQTLRQETAPMSGEWIVRTSGKSYQFLRVRPPEFERGTEYTLEMRVRGFGGDVSMLVLELYSRDGDGKIREGAHIANRIQITENFRTYYLPFRTTKAGRPFMIAFYKWSPREGENIGIDVASVRMFKGKVDALSISKIARTGRKAVAGPSIPMTPNPYGRGRKKIDALVFVKDSYRVREVQEVFAGLNATADILVTTATDQDVYLSETDQDDIAKRLSAGKYSVFCVLDGTGGSVGPIMSKLMIAAVDAGAGIYAAHDAKKGRLAALFEKASVKPVGKDHLFAKMFPGNLVPSLSTFKPATDMGEGRFGKGRVLLELCARPGGFKFMMEPSLYGKTDFPFSRFADPALAWLLYHVAGYDAASNPGGEIPVKVCWTSVDATGMIGSSGEAADESAAFAEARAACTVSGRHAVSMRSIDKDGFTIGWNTRFLTKDGPSLALEALRFSCDGNEPAVFRAMTVADTSDLMADWTLEDFSGRILEHGTAHPGVKFEVPVRSLYTNMGVLRARLRKGDAVLAVARAEIYARDRDFARLYYDFTVGVWGQRAACSRDAFVQIDRRLEDMGVRWQCMPLEIGGNYNFESSLANGMSVCGGCLGSSRCFVAQRLDGSNIRSRYGAINTAKARNAIASGARKTGRNAAPYGVLGYTVCDEPNLAEMYTADEPDEEPENVAEFSVRMEKKYGTMENYNRRHRTKHSAFADIKPVRLAEARASGNFAEYVEWRNFNVDRWCEVLKIMSDAGKSVDPRLKMSLFNSFGQTAASGNDYWKLLTKAGLDFSNEYTAMVAMRRHPINNFDEFYRSFRPDMRVWGFVGYGMDANQIAFAPWWFAAHRYAGLTWFSTLGIGYNLLDSPSLAMTQDAVDLKASLSASRLMDGIAKLMLAYRWQPRQAAIYYSHESMLVSTLLGKEKISYEVGKDGPLHDYMHSRQGVQYLLADLLYQHDFVAPEQVCAGALADRRILFLPCILALSDAEIVALKEFLRKGGNLVADRLPGDYDELGVRRKSNPFAADEVEVTGRNFDDLDRRQRTDMLSRLARAGVEPVLRSPGIENVFGREAMSFTDGTNLICCVIRMPRRSSDRDVQSFSFARTGHVYDVCAGMYLGLTNQVTAAVPYAGASVWSVLPYHVSALCVESPDTVRKGNDLEVKLTVDAGGNECGTHVFHVEIVPPSGVRRFHFSRNLTASGGRARLLFRIAANDPSGGWTLRAHDPLTGMHADRRFTVMEH